MISKKMPRGSALVLARSGVEAIYIITLTTAVDWTHWGVTRVKYPLGR